MTNGHIQGVARRRGGEKENINELFFRIEDKITKYNFSNYLKNSKNKSVSVT